MKRYGFLVIDRKRRWRATSPGRDQTEWFPTKEKAELARDKWQQEARADRDQAFQEACRDSQRKRRKFTAETEVEIVTVENPVLFQSDFKKPTIRFPDGSNVQFEEKTPAEEIDARIEAAALEAHPDPKPGSVNTNAQIEELNGWDAELILDGERHSLPDIEAWDHFFPMESVSAHLNALARAGWTVTHVSEDRGLYASTIASNMSAPLIVRYLLVNDSDNPDDVAAIVGEA